MNYKKYNQYKDSNIDWIAEIPANWKLNKINNLSLIHHVINSKIDIRGEEI